jgi:hypothetical protein
MSDSDTIPVDSDTKTDPWWEQSSKTSDLG